MVFIRRHWYDLGLALALITLTLQSFLRLEGLQLILLLNLARRLSLDSQRGREAGERRPAGPIPAQSEQRGIHQHLGLAFLPSSCAVPRRDLAWPRTSLVRPGRSGDLPRHHNQPQTEDLVQPRPRRCHARACAFGYLVPRRGHRSRLGPMARLALCPHLPRSLHRRRHATHRFQASGQPDVSVSLRTGGNAPVRPRAAPPPHRHHAVSSKLKALSVATS